MGGLGTSIIGRPRPSPPHRRAAPGHPTATPWIGKSPFSPEQRTSGLYVDRLFDSRSAQVGDVVILALQPNPNEQWSDRFAVVGGPLGRFTRQPSGDYLRAGNVETLGWRPSISEADL